MELGNNHASKPSEATRSHSDAQVGDGERKDVSILFCDIGSYAAATEKLEVPEVASFLAEYFQGITDAIFKHKQNSQRQIECACIGTATLAVFGTPDPLEDHGWVALQTAVAICDRIERLNRDRAASGQPAIRPCIGINSDRILGSNLGANQHIEFIAIGEGVNLGYRLQQVSHLYGCPIVISDNTYRACGDRVRVRELEKIRMQPKAPAISIYEFLGLSDQPISPQKQEMMKHYDEGRRLYLQRQFALAMGEFATAIEIDSSDRAATIQLERCQDLLQSPPSEDWDGTRVI